MYHTQDMICVGSVLYMFHKDMVMSFHVAMVSGSEDSVLLSGRQMGTLVVHCAAIKKQNKTKN